MAGPVFYLLSILLFPVTLLGYVIWVGRTLLAGRGSGVSATAQGPLSARFFQHKLGIRKDDAASRLMIALPNVPPAGLRLFAAPMLFAHAVTGYVPKAFRYPFEGDIIPQYQASARVTFFDAALDRHIHDVSQFVILGAGFDTRALNVASSSRVRCFEIDTPRTQTVKRRSLDKAAIDSTRVTFVSADFESEDWLAKLVAAGFDPARPAFFLWEGVTMYLQKEAVEDTLRKIASTASGSVVAFDYITTEPLESPSLFWRMARAATKSGGEPFKFGIDSAPPSRDQVTALLRSCGLSLADQRTLGQEAAGKRAWGGFVTARVS